MYHHSSNALLQRVGPKMPRTAILPVTLPMIASVLFDDLEAAAAVVWTLDSDSYVYHISDRNQRLTGWRCLCLLRKRLVPNSEPVYEFQ